MLSLVETLLVSAEPSVRYKIQIGYLGNEPDSPAARAVQEAVRTCPRTATLLSERDSLGRIPRRPYAKWNGAHWVLVALADLGYPPGDVTLRPLEDQVLGWLTSGEYDALIRKPKRGPTRIHASIDGNAVFAALKLGLPDPRLDFLVERLLATQWPDGGWNCDIDSKGETSSFTETIVPLRALALHARQTGSAETKTAARRAAGVFLDRHMFRRRANGTVIKSTFVKLHYPPYWHYDILFGLKVMAEAGLIGDPRCSEALDLVESKRLPDGGFPAEEKFYQAASNRKGSHYSLVDWGGVSTRRYNEWVTADALAVLKAARRA